MKKKSIQEHLYSRIISPQLLLPLAISGIIIIIVSTFLEYRSRKQDYLNLLESQATVFVKTLANTTQIAYAAASEFENEITTKLYSNLELIERLDRKERLTETQLNDILSISLFDEIHIYDSAYKPVLLTSSVRDLQAAIPSNILGSVSQNTRERTPFVLPDTANYTAVLILREKGGVIAGVISSDKIQQFRKKFGLGQFLKSFIAAESVEYIAIENKETIVAGFFTGFPLSSFAIDNFLSETLAENTIKSRILEYEQGAVFEAVAPFSYGGETFGVLRLGLSTNELEVLNARAKKRMFIFSGLLVVLGLVFLNFVLSYRHRQLLRKELAYLSEYTNTVLENLESGVITVDGDGLIKVVNRQASSFLGSGLLHYYNMQYSIFPEQFSNAIENCLNNRVEIEHSQRFQVSATNESRWLSLRTTHLKTNGEPESCILLVDDVTEQVHLEEQIRRNEKLDAMRKLASAVAHEIRNPLNSINLIVDLLKMNFQPAENEAKYNKYITTVQKEIIRISSIVEEFLRFARPPKHSPQPVDFREFFGELETLFQARFEEAGLFLYLEIQPHPELSGDPEQLKQVFVNLIENAIDAGKPQGRIEISGLSTEKAYEIRVKDDGCGINKRDMESIFDIYFTTKKKGSGIGLAIVHQIITRHSGTVEVYSDEGAGTTFLIRLPYNISLEIPE